MMRIIWAFLLMAPSFIHIVSIRDHVWNFDRSIYGAAAVKLFITLVNHPIDWLSAIITTHHAKVPGLFFLGEFFVPIGYILGSINLGLLLCIFCLSILSLLLLWQILERRS